MPGLIGKKLGMTRIYHTDGSVVPVTVFEAGPCSVVSVRTKDKDGYEALQLGFGEKKQKHVNKPQWIQYKNAGVKAPQVLKEFKGFNVSDYKPGDSVNVEIFTVGEKVKVVSKSKGKGFQGVIKRHGFSGVGGRTHGQHNRERSPGSVGQSSDPSRIFKGMRMAGRTGGTTVSMPNLSVVKILPEKNVIMVKGSVPGSINSIVEIKKIG